MFLMITYRSQNLIASRLRIPAILILPVLFLLHAALMSTMLVDIKADFLQGEPIIEQPIEDPDGRALFGFYEALTRTLARQGEKGSGAVTRIVHYGDSHVAADILTGELRRYFQRDFGDAGTGFVIPGHSWYLRKALKSDAGLRWRVDGLGQNSTIEDGRYGLSGISLSAERPGERIRVRAECSRFMIYLLKQPHGGSVDLLLDGITYHHRVSLRSKRFEPLYLEVEADGDGPHTIELITITGGPVRLLGVTAEKRSTGVVYDALGINGARAGRPLTWDWRILADNLERRLPDLIIVAYGTNEVSDEDLDLEEYRRNFSELLGRLRQAAPQASLLVIGPPDRALLAGSRWRSIGAMQGLIEAQREAALSSGAAFWDLYQMMGGQGSIDQWAKRAEPLAQPDRVHLSKSGYKLVAEAFYHELMRGYLQALWKDRWVFWCRF
jgi:lysophospholipase L1-like esterase